MEQITIKDVTLAFKKIGKVFTSRGDVLEMISDYNMNQNKFNKCKIDHRFFEGLAFWYTCTSWKCKR